MNSLRLASTLLLPLLLAGCDGGGDDSAAGDPCDGGSGTVCTILGTGVAGLPTKGGCALEEPTYLVLDMAMGPDNWLYYLDWNNHQVIRLQNHDGKGCDPLDLVMGTTMLGDGPEGPAEQSAWNHPTNLVFGPDGWMYVAAWHNSRVVRWDPVNDVVDFYAGTGKRAYNGDEIPADTADLDLPVGVDFDPAGNLYIADQANQRIRQIDTDFVIHTVVGTGEYGYNGDEIPATDAMLFNELSQAAAPAGKLVVHDNKMYIADTGNYRVRMVTMDDWIIHTFAGTGEHGYSGDGGPATAAKLSGIRDVDVGPDGTIYIADTDNHCIRAVDAAGNISTVAGVCGQSGYAGDGGPATEALFYDPFGIEVAEDGTLYIADTYNNVIRRVAP